jgi:ornithine--oxo-acid transaminase
MSITLKDKALIGFSPLPDNEVFDIEDIYGAKHYRRLKTVVRKTQGAWLYTQDGRKILDCLAAYSAANPGHHHPKIVDALIRALQENYASVISNVVYTDVLALFLKKVAELVPQLGPRFGNNGNKVLPKTAESNRSKPPSNLLATTAGRKKGFRTASRK